MSPQPFSNNKQLSWIHNYTSEKNLETHYLLIVSSAKNIQSYNYKKNHHAIRLRCRYRKMAAANESCNESIQWQQCTKPKGCKQTFSSVFKCFPANLRQVGETLGTLSIAVDLSQLIQCHAKCWVGAATAAVLPITLWHSTHTHWSIQSFQCQVQSQNFVNWGWELVTAGWMKL